jgi:hypothetical protein
MLEAVQAAKRIAADIEGIDLDRNGKICLLAIAISPTSVWVVDVVALGDTAFKPVASGQASLKDILESPEIEKLIFDPRMDSDALFHQFGVHLKNVFDVQLAEVGVPRVFARSLPMHLSSWHLNQPTTIPTHVMHRSLTVALGACLRPTASGWASALIRMCPCRQVMLNPCNQWQVAVGWLIYSEQVCMMLWACHQSAPCNHMRAQYHIYETSQILISICGWDGPGHNALHPMMYRTQVKLSPFRVDKAAVHMRLDREREYRVPQAERVSGVYVSKTIQVSPLACLSQLDSSAGPVTQSPPVLAF